MPRYMVIHTMPPGEMTREEAMEFDQAAQSDPKVKGYRSFVNLSEGKAVCVYEAPDKDTLAEWLGRKAIDYDTITEVELEGQHGIMVEV